MEGKGVHVCAEGSRYEGDLRANYRHGQGRCQWGNRHDAPFRQEQREQGGGAQGGSGPLGAYVLLKNVWYHQPVVTFNVP